MAQAILILAHKDADYIYSLSVLLKKNFNVYVHFDTKFSLTEEVKDKFHAANIFVCQKINVKWGAFSIVEATFVLMKEALKNKDNTFFHLISGQDFPIIDINKIFEFYEGNTNIYMTYSFSKNCIKSHENVLWWQKYYFYFDKISRRTWYGKIYHRISLIFQILLGINKFKSLDINEDMYHCSEWIDIPREPLEYVFTFLNEHKNWLKLFQTSAFPDESIFQTILCNSKYKEKIINNNHRYIDWKHKYKNGPKFLDVTDYDKIKKTNCHFARKIDKNISKELIIKLKKELII